MYIIFSPTKLMNLDNPLNVKESYRFKGSTDMLLNYFYDMDLNQIKEVFALKSAQLNHEVYKFYHDFKIRKQPLTLYNGQSFKQLELDSYQDDEYKYLNDHLRIISALYGVLKPFDVIFPYRLDFKTKIDINLTKHWSDIINFDLCTSDVIINLASKEFSSLVDHPNKINIIFKQLQNAEYKMISTRCKQARGIYLNWMVKNKIDVNRLTEFDLNGYLFVPEESNKNNLVFKTINK